MKIATSLALMISLPFFAAHAETAKPLSTQECQEVLAKMTDLQQRRQSEQNKAIDGLRENSSVMLNWYQVYSQYEGKSSVVPEGSFDVMKESSQIVANNAEIVTQNFDLLDKENNSLISLVHRCIR